MPPTTTLGPIIAAYLTGRLRRGEIKATTAEHLDTRLRSLAAHFADTPLTLLDRRAVEAWQEATFPHLSPATRCSYLSTIRVFCAWMAAEGHLPADPTTGIASVRRPRRVPRAQPASAVARLFDVCDNDRDRLIVWLMVGLGLRRGEVAGARLEDYDAAARLLVVTGKGGDQRALPVSDDVAAAIAVYHKDRLWATGPLVRRRRGNTPLEPRSVTQIVGKLFSDAGLKRFAYDGNSAHALRHTAASDVLDVCHDLRVVQQMLGHASLATTQIYLRRADLGQLRAAMAGRSYGQPA